jgi:tRNA 2-thiocytidine biosynthesis protein TtcA
LKTGLEKTLRHSVGKAIHDWSMIQDKDRILVGISGGQDSLTLLQVSFSLEKIAPVEFDIVPVHIDHGALDMIRPLAYVEKKI